MREFAARDFRPIKRAQKEGYVSLATSETRFNGLTAALALAGLFSLALVLSALFFEHVIGLAPCALCLEQRWPHYAAIPVALIGFLLRPRFGALFLLLLIGLMLWSAGLGAYHAGVEWGWWPGPAGCSATQTLPQAGDLLGALGEARVPSCTEAMWRFLGLSLAGYNALLSATMALLLALAMLRQQPSA
jgi:disulfide bond formation protein DsbB